MDAAVSRRNHSSSITFTPILSCKLAMVVTRSQLPQRSPTPFTVPCTCVAPASTAARAFATPQPGVVVGVDAYLDLRELPHRARHYSLELCRQRPAVRVAEDERRGPCPCCCAQQRQRIVGVVAEAVEVVLGVEDNLFACVRQVGHRVLHGLQVLLRRGPQDLLDVQLASPWRRCKPRVPRGRRGASPRDRPRPSRSVVAPA